MKLQLKIVIPNATRVEIPGWEGLNVLGFTAGSPWVDQQSFDETEKRFGWDLGQERRSF